MAEPARKRKDRVVQFPQQPGSEAHITMSEAELKEMIWDIVAAARKKKHKTKPTNSLYTKDGRIKPSPADPIRSKEDFQKLANYLASNGDPKFRLRNKAIFVFGCSLGIRCGDLLNLKTADVYEQDGSVKEHVELIEEKTGINTMTAEDPLTAVAIGTGKYIEYLADDDKKSKNK